MLILDRRKMPFGHLPGAYLSVYPSSLSNQKIPSKSFHFCSQTKKYLLW